MFVCIIHIHNMCVRVCVIYSTNIYQAITLCCRQHLLQDYRHSDDLARGKGAVLEVGRRAGTAAPAERLLLKDIRLQKRRGKRAMRRWKGATTFSITTFCISTLSITAFSITTFSMTTIIVMKLSVIVNKTQHSA
jgi:hypothetical protein